MICCVIMPTAFKYTVQIKVYTTAYHTLKYSSSSNATNFVKHFFTIVDCFRFFYLSLYYEFPYTILV